MSDSEWTAERVAELRSVATAVRGRKGVSEEELDAYCRFANLASPSGVLSLLDALESEREYGGWIAVTPETMPQPGLVVLVHYLFGGRESRVRDASWDGNDVWLTDRGRIGTPTHWRPLPSPPVLP